MSDAAAPDTPAPPPYRVWKTPEIRRAVAAFEALGYEVTGFESTAGGFRLLTRKARPVGDAPGDQTDDDTPEGEIARRRAQLAAQQQTTAEGRVSQPPSR